MWWYIGRRVLQAIPVFLGATLLIYALVFLRPGDPILGLFGDKPVSEAVKAQIEAQYHLDQPFLVQWLYFLKGVVTFDLGLSFSGQPVIELIAQAYPALQVARLYRLRWQVELAIKRLKSLLRIDRLPAKSPDLARAWLAANCHSGWVAARSDPSSCVPRP